MFVELDLDFKQVQVTYVKIETFLYFLFSSRCYYGAGITVTESII